MLHPKILTETQFSVSKIDPTYDYVFKSKNNERFTNFDLSLLKISAQWSPFSEFDNPSNNTRETKVGYPKFTMQYTKSFANIFKSDFNFSKLDFRVIQQFNYINGSNTQIVLASGIANGNAPITHLYHAYPNNVNKETIMQRFSVAGINSFETMFFNEFFSDKFSTLQIKQTLKPFNISLPS